VPTPSAEKSRIPRVPRHMRHLVPATPAGSAYCHLSLHVSICRSVSEGNSPGVALALEFFFFFFFLSRYEPCIVPPGTCQTARDGHAIQLATRRLSDSLFFCCSSIDGPQPVIGEYVSPPPLLLTTVRRHDDSPGYASEPRPSLRSYRATRPFCGNSLSTHRPTGPPPPRSNCICSRSTASAP